MVNTGTGAKNIFTVIEHILLEYIQNNAHGYFGLKVIGNINLVLPNTLKISGLTQLAGGNAIEIQNFHDRVRSEMIAKAIEG